MDAKIQHAIVSMTMDQLYDSGLSVKINAGSKGDEVFFVCGAL